MRKVLVKRSTKEVYVEAGKLYKSFVVGYPKANVLNEALNQARVEETGLSIPKVLGVTTVDSRWSIVSEYIEGKTLAELMQENPDKMSEYIAQFVDFQMMVHSKNSPLLNKLKDKIERKINELSDLDSTVRYELLTKLNTMPKHFKVCHGDYNPSNVVVTADGKWYLLDWAHATQGNASADVALTYLLFLLDGKTQIANDYLRCYCEKSGTNIRYIQKWVSIVAAVQMENRTAKEKEFLRKFIEVVEY